MRSDLTDFANRFKSHRTNHLAWYVYWWFDNVVGFTKAPGNFVTTKRQQHASEIWSGSCLKIQEQGQLPELIGKSVLHPAYDDKHSH